MYTVIFFCDSVEMVTNDMPNENVGDLQRTN